MKTFFDGGEIAEDVLSIQSINRSIPGPAVTVPNFIFNCSPSFLTKKLGEDVKGMVGFGQQSPVSLATQLATTFRFRRQFAICLSASTDQNGVIFIGHKPYLFALSFDASSDLIYTPIITHPNIFHNNRASPEYYIQVSSIRINGKSLPLNRTLLAFDENDDGGTRISTAIPCPVLEPSIYSSVSKAFVNEMPKDVKTVSPVHPFKTCFNSSFIGMSRLGYNAPKIYLVLHKPNVYWTITGTNSSVNVSESVVCLAFVERSQTWGHAIVIGGYQMQANLVEFDLSRKRIGFSNSLLSSNNMRKSVLYHVPVIGLRARERGNFIFIDFLLQ
ncbi:putative aspartic proteinase GIP2 [Nicotiana tabacum]|uniref:Aspartic proteinase GIP2 n=1 Tax=Nicotiana tabacum TaxID=4097 RepID=A0AC58U084_TOBAC|nr:probable aspartic proteinase GIP2 [Nicotiana tomentosiformis]